MEGKIQVLDEVVANKIAAGEVVERPAAVVKELLENSIDAQATKIEIEIEESGTKLIKVADNGSGMIKTDAILSLERHATSKIRQADDLFRINTLGFRGEALPSIAAISTLELTTRISQHLEGTYIKVVGGEIKEVKEIGCPVGTTISVKNLFFNTPARLKYLKSAAIEMGHIIDIVNHLSLAHPHISLRLTHNNRPVLFSTGSDNLQEVVLNIYGKQTAKEMIPIGAGSMHIQLKGLIGKPAVARGSRNHMIFFVNGRFIRSRIIGRAVEEAYRTFLPIRKYPVVVLDFQINPEEIDVNVHPTKTEIRFSNERDVYLLTYQTISQALKGMEIIPEISIERKETVQVPDTPTFPLLIPKEYPRSEFKQEPRQQIDDAFSFHAKKNPEEVTEKVQEKAVFYEAKQEVRQTPANLPGMEILGQVHKTFIIAQGKNGIFILDQHAAHERILYEKIKANRKQREVTSQSLLIPIILELTPKERVIWPELEKILLEVGFEVENFGGDSYLIRGIPIFMEGKNVLPLIREIIDDFISSTKGKDTEDWQERSIITMSCRLAIKAGDHLERKEMEELIKTLEQTNNPYTCPHGRPTIIDFSWEKLEENFKRR